MSRRARVSDGSIGPSSSDPRRSPRLPVSPRLAALGAALTMAAVTSPACGVLREGEPGEPRCDSYAQDVRPLLVQRCGECHVAKAEGGYSVDRYEDALAPGDGGLRRVVAGEPQSPLLLAARGALAGHATPLAASELSQLEAWVVRCRAAPRELTYHRQGYSTPGDGLQSHGAQLRDAGYDVAKGGGEWSPFTSCRECHGIDLSGGEARVACSTCHTEARGAQGCGTCHGVPPPDHTDDRCGNCHGAGYADGGLDLGRHANQTLDVDGALGCVTCHGNPPANHRDNRCGACHGSAYASGGIDSALHRNGTVDARLDCGACHGNPPVGHRDDRCGACHGVAYADGGTDAVLHLNGTVEARLDCGACHGNPPASHPASAVAGRGCESCHGAAYEDGGVDATLHLDGNEDVSARCDACHAGPESPAFFDLSGSSDPARRSVGAHQAHLTAGTFRGPMSCRECHAVPAPAQLFAAGHFDSSPGAEVFPASGGGSIAWADSAQPVWSAAAGGTCSNVYCHGGGQDLAGDTTATVQRTLPWVGDGGVLGCASCHGMPPQGIDHSPGTNCRGCHSLSVAAGGAIIFDGGTSRHLDGQSQSP